MWEFRMAHYVAAWSLSQVPTLEVDRVTRLQWQREALRGR